MKAKEQGFPVNIVDPPESDPYIDYYLGIFFELCSFRVELQPLRLESIQSYCEMFNVDDVETLLKWIIRLDAKYREIMFDKQQKEMKQAAKRKGKR